MRLVVCLALLGGCSKGDQPPPAPLELVAPRPIEKPKPPGGSQQRLFADDVAATTLPLSIAIETIGGVSSVLIPRGTKLPISRSEVFSTGADNQSSVEVHIVQGERPMAVDNRSLGKFQLGGIPPAPRGVPQIEVTFTVLEEGVLEVSARDKATNEIREVRIDGATTALDKATLDKILADTTAKQGEDQQRLAWSEARNKLDGFVTESKHLLANVGDKLSARMKKRWSDEVSRAEVLLASATKPGDPKLMQTALAALQTVMHDGAEELYKSSK